MGNAMLAGSMRDCRNQTKTGLPLTGLLALALYSLVGACQPIESGKGRGVLLIAIDELRLDHMSAMGYDRKTTPNLDSLVEKSVLFTRAYSTAPLLIPAHTSLLTGCYPAVASRKIPKRIQIPESNRWHVPESVPRLSIEFLSADYSTAAFMDTESLNKFGAYDHGFQVFDQDERQDRRARKERGGLALSAALRDWLAELAPDRNWFAYLHLRDLSRIWREANPKWDDYFPVEEGDSFIPPVGSTDDVFFTIPKSRWAGWPRTLAAHEQRYDGAIRRIDSLLGTLFRNLELEGLSGNTTICVVGTYGLQFGESGLLLRSGLLTSNELHVPWILRLAPRDESSLKKDLVNLQGGRRLTHLASLVDVAPTLLEWEGLPIPSGMHGHSHIPVLNGEAERVRSHAFASEGMVDGAVVFGEEWAFEELRFNAKSPELLEQWFGTSNPRGGLVEQSFHSLQPQASAAEAASSSKPSADEADALKLALADWEQNISQTREILQTSLESDHIEDELLIQRLTELGYLGELR